MITVLKLGGELLEDAAAIHAIVPAILRLAQRGPLVVVHGGGRAIDGELRARGEEPRFVDGLRVTDAAALDAVVCVLAGRNNTALVAAIIAGVAAWPLLLAPLVGRHLAPELAMAGGLALAAVFLLRGVAGFTPWMARRHSAEPFATYNRRYYSPLCLALGAGFLSIAFNGGTP